MFTPRFSARAWVTLLALISFVPAQAQPLIEHVPDDAVVYIGWNGVEGLGPQFEGSHFQGLLKAVDVPRLGRDILGMLENFNEIEGFSDSEGLLQAMDVMSEIADTLWRYPTAFYFAGFEGSPAKSLPRLALICRMGDAAVPMAEKWNKLFESPGSPPVHAEAREGILIVKPRGMKPQEGGSLKQSKAFAHAMRSAVQPAQAVLYLDLEKTWAIVEKGIAGESGEEDAKQFRKIIGAIGLEDIKRYAWTAGFEGKSWKTRAFTDSPAPRRGLASLYDSPPVDAEILKHVPMTASWFSAWRFDLSKVYDTLRQGVDQMDANALQSMDEMIARLKAETGIDLQGLLSSLGDQWLLYDDQSLGGGPAGASLVLIHKLKDTPRFAQSLAKVEELIAGLLEGNEMAQMLSLQKIESEGMQIRSIGIITMAVSWSVHEGHLYFGLFPQSLIAAADNIKSGRKSILEQPKYQELLKQLGTNQARAISYDDLQWTAGTMYQSAVMLAQMAQGLGGDNDGKARSLVLPPLGRLLPLFHPAGHASWTDDEGFHTVGYSPFPGSRLFSPQVVMQSGIPVTAMSIGILLPSLGRARELANRTVAGVRLNGIYKAMNTYSVVNQEQFPPDLGTLVLDGSISPKIVINPRAGNKVPVGETLEELAAWTNENSDFVIRFAQVGPNSNADEIIGYEKIQPGVREGLNILWGDGHVEFVEELEALELLREAGEDVPDELPGSRGGSLSDLLGFSSSSSGRAKGQPGNAWYYDTVTKEIFQDKTTQIAPFKRPNGNEAVRVHLFTCGDCVEGERFVGYYEKYTDEVRKKLDESSESFILYEMAFQGRLYSADGIHWVPAEKPEGAQITSVLQGRCPPKKLRYCPPLGPEDKFELK